MINTCLFMDLNQNIYFSPSVTALQTLIKVGSMLHSTRNLEDSSPKPRYFSCFVRYLGCSSSRNPLRWLQERWRLASTSCTVILKQLRHRVGRLRTSGHTAHGASQPALKICKSRNEVGGKARSTDRSHTWREANSAG